MTMSCKPEHPRAIIIYYKYMSGKSRFDGIKFLLGHGRKMFFRWLWWHRWTLLNLQPLRCRGNSGGWQTSFCNWLEEKARAAEDREDLKLF